MAYHWGGLVVLLSVTREVLAQAGTCPSNTGPILGAIFGTVAVIGLILGIIALVFYLRKQKDKKNIEKLKKEVQLGQDNPTFVGDLETGGAREPFGNNHVLSKQHKLEGGFPGYVECKEYESPVKKQATVAGQQNGSGPGRVLFLDEDKTPQIRKAGSRGSLDNNYPGDQDYVSVPLLSQDIMGLGFNVDGNMKEGIFVSKLHKRGPAHDTGLVAVGDRIMSVTVSFENMVLEDAMTILSYASPYPVKLCLQKANSVKVKSEMSEVAVSVTVETEEDNINHPVYRSQSLDDLRQIGKEGLLHPRRTWSEWKKPGYIPSKAAVGETNLKKWKAKQDMVQEESSEGGDLQTQSTSASNFSIPDLKIDMSDLRMGSDVDVSQGIGVYVDEDKTSVSSSSDKPVNVTDLNMSIDSLNVDQDAKREVKYALNVIPAESEGRDEVDVVTMSTGAVTFSSRSDDNEMTCRQQDSDQHVKVDTEISLASKEFVENLEGRDSSSRSDDSHREEVSLAALLPTEVPPALPNTDEHSSTDEKAAVNGEEPTVRDVIRDYFGDNPNILQQFGLPSDGTRTVRVTEVTGEDGITVTKTEHVDMENGFRSTTVTETTTEVISGSPDSGFMGTRPSLEIKRSSSSSSPNSSCSSRSPSPIHKEDEGVEIETIVTRAVPATNASPLINKKSVGGLTFDVSDLGDKSAPKEDNKSSEAPRGGVAYYFSIDQHGSPAHAIRPLGTTEREDLDQPRLVRPETISTEHIISSTSINSYDSSSGSQTTVVTHDETRYESDKHVKDLNDNSRTLTLQGKLTGSSEDVKLSDSSNKTESVTIIRQTEVPEAFTVTVNTDDSAA